MSNRSIRDKRRRDYIKIRTEKNLEDVKDDKESIFYEEYLNE